MIKVFYLAKKPCGGRWYPAEIYQQASVWERHQEEFRDLWQNGTSY